jgi:hypothetical protein
MEHGRNTDKRENELLAFRARSPPASAKRKQLIVSFSFLSVFFRVPSVANFFSAPHPFFNGLLAPPELISR